MFTPLDAFHSSYSFSQMYESQAIILQSRIRQYHAINKVEDLRIRNANSIVLKRFVRIYHAVEFLDELRRAYEEKVWCFRST